MLNKLAQLAVNNRRRLPKWLQDALNSVTSDRNSLFSRVSTWAVRGPVAPPTDVPASPIRVYIAPTNYAGQGYQWARCLERADAAIGARNVAVRIPGGFAFPADRSVSLWQSTYSRAWSATAWAQVAKFSHVLIEAERPLLGAEFGGDLRAEVAALRERGISVAFLSHGTDIRDPEQHRAAHALSPYHVDPRTKFLAEQAHRNRALLAEFGGPQFVSTPDLLSELPDAHWCPVVIDPTRFETERLPFASNRPRVIHISSDPVQKGSDLVANALADLVRDGVIEFDLIEGVPSADIPALLAEADIVLDQFRLASYGVAACEAMATGRIVIGNVSEQVRQVVRTETQRELPILQALPAELPSVITGLLADRDAARHHAHLGIEFARAVHSGARSADVLREHWIRAERPSAG